MRYAFLFIVSISCGSLFSQDTLPQLEFGGHKSGSVIPLSFVKSIPDSVYLVFGGDIEKDLYRIIDGTMQATGVESTGHILENGVLSQDSKHILESAKPGKITFSLNCLNTQTHKTETFTLDYMLGIVPMVTLGSVEMGDLQVDPEALRDIHQIGLSYTFYPEFNKYFTIVGGSISSEASEKKGKILEGGIFDQDALEILQSGNSGQYTIICTYTDSSGVYKRTSFVFKVR